MPVLNRSLASGPHRAEIEEVIVARVVSPDAVARPPAEQPVDRQARRLARQIPQRQVEALIARISAPAQP